jgi:hypothetical protein
VAIDHGGVKSLKKARQMGLNAAFALRNTAAERLGSRVDLPALFAGG